MNLVRAIRLMVAAKEDPVLAAWTSLVDDDGAANPDSISPYDAWDAYQSIYAHGLVSATEFHNTDPSRSFFASSSRPAWGAVQSVLYTLKALPERQEPPMSSKTRMPVDPFGNNNDTALSPREERAPMAPGRSSAGLPARPFAGAPLPSSGISPFGSREVMSPDHHPAPTLEGFAPSSRGRSNLACHDPQSIADVGGMKLVAEVYCCGVRMDMVVDGGQVIGPDDLPGGQVSVVDAIFHGRCVHCQAVWHCSVGKMLNQESFRG